MKRAIVIGDVHGCLDELERLLEACAATSDDRLIQVGDLVAKGPDTLGVLRLCRERRIEAVLGNHDAHLLRHRAQRSGATGEGGCKKPSPDLDALADSLQPEDWTFLESLPFWLRIPEHQALVVHAGLVPGVPLEEQSRENLLSMRSITPEGKGSKRLEDGVPWASVWQGPELVLFGHDAVRGFQSYPLAVGLDTGCVYGRELTAVVLPERRRVSVPSRRVYCAPTVRD